MKGGLRKESGRRASNSRIGGTGGGNSQFKKRFSVGQLYEELVKWREEDNTRFHRLEEKIERCFRKLEESSWADVYSHGNDGGSQRKADEGLFERRENLGWEGVYEKRVGNVGGRVGKEVPTVPNNNVSCSLPGDFSVERLVSLTGGMCMKGSVGTDGEAGVLSGDAEQIPVTFRDYFSGELMVIEGLERYTAPPTLGAGVIQQQYLPTSFGNLKMNKSVSEHCTKGTFIKQKDQQDKEFVVSSEKLDIRPRTNIFSEPASSTSSLGLISDDSDKGKTISGRQGGATKKRRVIDGIQVERVAHAMEHDKVPTDKKHWKCICGYTTPSAYDIRAHVTNGITTEPRLECSVAECKLRFNCRQLLKIHLISSHGYTRYDLANDFHKCKTCVKVFKYKKALYNHLRCQDEAKQRSTEAQSQQRVAGEVCKQKFITPQ